MLKTFTVAKQARCWHLSGRETAKGPVLEFVAFPEYVRKCKTQAPSDESESYAGDGQPLPFFLGFGNLPDGYNAGNYGHESKRESC